MPIIATVMVSGHYVESHLIVTKSLKQQENEDGYSNEKFPTPFYPTAFVVFLIDRVLNKLP